MGVSQVQASFQNDGNFSQLDLQDTALEGPILRIETFRCSQPEGEFGATASGSSVKAIAGTDHLSEESNRTFRHVFSTGKGPKPEVTLEIRETFDEQGRLEVRTRDTDSASDTFGWTLISTFQATEDGVKAQYELLKPENVEIKKITSPISAPISKHVATLNDIGGPVAKLGNRYAVNGIDILEVELSPSRSNTLAFEKIDAFARGLRETAPRWTENVKTYERMGDFRDKCIHPGTNLTGPHVALASEYVLIRAYRMSLITLGRVFDDEMAAGVEALRTEDALSIDPKPGVYSVFLSAYALNIGHYQLGIDKVHSDYGGVPMALKPGSRLETGATPIVDATAVNRMLALVAALFYVPSSLRGTVETRPAITSFEPKSSISFLAN
tara:strand:- start:287 stop:1438 length:1152 start_codon:yes stop_codon:yes gene_type:complete